MELHSQQAGWEGAALTPEPFSHACLHPSSSKGRQVGGRPPWMKEALALLGVSWAPRPVQHPCHRQGGGETREP